MFDFMQMANSPQSREMLFQMMSRQMDKIDIPPVREFIEMISDSGGKLYACQATVDMYGLSMDDFVPQVEKVLTVGEFYELSAGGEIIFT